MRASRAEYIAELGKRRRFETRDSSVPQRGRERRERTDLGLALLSMHALPGVRYSFDEIAAWCGCTNSAIQQIEERALRKLRNYLQFRRPDILDGLRSEFFDRRTAEIPNRKELT